jgi:hypothetical protein
MVYSQIRHLEKRFFFKDIYSIIGILQPLDRVLDGDGCPFRQAFSVEGQDKPMKEKGIMKSIYLITCIFILSLLAPAGPEAGLG